MRKQFNLQYYIDHPETKVVTRDGRNVRILCTDLDGNNGYCVAAALSEHGCTENLSSFTKEGHFWSNLSESNNDLFFDLSNPAKKRVPLTYMDLLERWKSYKTMWFINDCHTVFNIVDFDFESVYTINGDTEELVPFSYEDPLTFNCHFVDGTPCWKEVEE